MYTGFLIQLRSVAFIKSSSLRRRTKVKTIYWAFSFIIEVRAFEQVMELVSHFHIAICILVEPHYDNLFQSEACGFYT